MVVEIKTLDQYKKALKEIIDAGKAAQSRLIIRSILPQLKQWEEEFRHWELTLEGDIINEAIIKLNNL